MSLLFRGPSSRYRNTKAAKHSHSGQKFTPLASKKHARRLGRPTQTRGSPSDSDHIDDKHPNLACQCENYGDESVDLDCLTIENRWAIPPLQHGGLGRFNE